MEKQTLAHRHTVPNHARQKLMNLTPRLCDVSEKQKKKAKKKQFLAPYFSNRGSELFPLTLFPPIEWTLVLQVNYHMENIVRPNITKRGGVCGWTVNTQGTLFFCS